MMAAAPRRSFVAGPLVFARFAFATARKQKGIAFSRRSQYCLVRNCAPFWLRITDPPQAPRPLLPSQLQTIMPLASRDARLLAQLLDAIVAFSPILALTIASAMNERLDFLFDMLLSPGIFFFICYILFADALPGGQSVAKRMLGIAVVDRRTGQPCSALQSLVRNVPLAVLGILDWIFIYGKQQQRLGDMVAGTLVVEAAAVGRLAGYRQ